MSFMSIDCDDDENKEDNTNLAPNTKWIWGDSIDENKPADTKEKTNEVTFGTSTNIDSSNNMNEDNVKDDTKDNSNSVNPWSFGVTNSNDNNNPSKNDNNSNKSPISNNFSFGTSNTTDNNVASNNSVDDTSNTNSSSNNQFSFGVTNNDASTNDNNNDATTTFAFGITNNTTSTNKTISNRFTFGTSNTNDDNNNTSNSNAQFSFGVSNDTTPSNDNNNNDNNNNDNDNNDNDNSGGGWTPTFGVSNDNNNDDNTNNNNSTGWTFGTSNNNNDNPSPITTDVNANANTLTSSWKPTAKSDDDPFAAFTAKQQLNNNDNNISQQSPSPNTNDNNNTNITPNPNPPTPPSIDENDIDQDAKAAFLAMFHASIKDQWVCKSCNNFNPLSKNICEACEASRPKQDTTTTTTNNNITASSDKNEVDEMDMDETKENENDTSNEHKFEYYDILKKNNEILEYSLEENPKPKYFPYDHDDKEEELEEEVYAWGQFDSEDEEEDNEKDIKIDDKEDAIDEKVKLYMEYKERRKSCKQQVDAINKRKKLKQDDILIAMCGDGSVGGQLGVGNGSVTTIKNNVSPFPFIMESLLKKKQSIKLSTAGIMSTAIVTTDNQIYVWGLNDKSELTINPRNINEVDVGDDDDQLNDDIAWDRLYKYYYQKIEDIYKKYNANKLVEKEGFVENLLMKRKVGKIMMKYKKKSEMKEGSLYDQDTIQKIVQRFEDKCKMEDKKRKKNDKASYSQEINIEETAGGIHAVYIKICDKFAIDEQDRVAFFIPKATESEIMDRRDRRLNPYKYLKKPKLDSVDSENKKPALLKSEVTMDINDSDVDSDFEYEQKEPAICEDNFQGTLSCSYWTPANIRLPYKMVVKQVTLGGTHMVVLDALGGIWSSGTFISDDGPIGHHYDTYTKEIIRYQRTLCKISNIESQDDGLASRRLDKNKKLPSMDMIASGVNHFLMLDYNGNVWKMGVTKLGQRWCARNRKKYLCPQRVSVINIAQNKRATKRVKFKYIACGNHHNVAISRDLQLYTWGQNIWLQCGHPKNECGYGNVVDQPRLVLFYKNKLNVNNIDEKDILLSQYPKIINVCAGEHMTVALDERGKVYTCGRNACGALGRKTRSEGVKDYGTHKVKTEVKPDFMRQVMDLNHIIIDWIGCGSVFWYAHNKLYGNVYSYGDSSNGRVGIGQWKYCRGRTVFDKYNFDLKRFNIINANGGSDHCVFMIQKKGLLKYRHSAVPSNASNSREGSLNLDSETGIVNGISNLGTDIMANDNNNNNGNNNFRNFNSKIIPASHQPKRKITRKRSRNDIKLSFDNIPEEEEVEELKPKRRKLNDNNNKKSNKPISLSKAKTSPSPTPQHRKNI